MKETEKNILKATKMKVQEVVNIELNRRMNSGSTGVANLQRKIATLSRRSKEWINERMEKVHQKNATEKTEPRKERKKRHRARRSQGVKKRTDDELHKKIEELSNRQKRRSRSCVTQVAY